MGFIVHKPSQNSQKFPSVFGADGSPGLGPFFPFCAVWKHPIWPKWTAPDFFIVFFSSGKYSIGIAGISQEEIYPFPWCQPNAFASPCASCGKSLKRKLLPWFHSSFGKPLPCVHNHRANECDSSHCRWYFMVLPYCVNQVGWLFGTVLNVGSNPTVTKYFQCWPNNRWNVSNIHCWFLMDFIYTQYYGKVVSICFNGIGFSTVHE